jgi:hypothetical protein
MFGFEDGRRGSPKEEGIVPLLEDGQLVLRTLALRCRIGARENDESAAADPLIGDSFSAGRKSAE